MHSLDLPLGMFDLASHYFKGYAIVTANYNLVANGCVYTRSSTKKTHNDTLISQCYALCYKDYKKQVKIKIKPAKFSSRSYQNRSCLSFLPEYPNALCW